MKKNLYIIFVLLIIALGLYAFSKNLEPVAWPIVTQEKSTNREMLKTENVTPIITQSDVEYFEGASGYFAMPEVAGDYPGIVMIHENRGLRPEIRGMADDLAREGYMVLAVDLLGDVVETQEEARELTANFNQAIGVENMRSAVRFLEDRGATKVGSLGWCFGGAQSLQLALSGEMMDATVIYYGRLATSTEALSPIKWPVLGVFGGEDQVISIESVEQFDVALDTLGVENEIYIYPEVGHAFANPSGMNYAPDETKDAWAKTVSFLNRHLR